jgi:glutamine amidotransferase
VRFPDNLREADNALPLKIPQMGWNGARIVAPHPVFADLPEGSEFYFVHSYYPRPGNPADGAAVTTYGLEFASGVARDNLVAFQFHPEKSGRPGLKLLDNFCRWKTQ